MSAAAVAAIASSLWKQLLPHLKRLGQWLIARVRKHGVKRVLSFMELRMETFRGRLERTKSRRRKRWLSGRIKRWKRASAWLADNAKHLRKKVASVLADRAESSKRVEWDAAGESYRRWKRAAA